MNVRAFLLEARAVRCMPEVLQGCFLQLRLGHCEGRELVYVGRVSLGSGKENGLSAKLRKRMNGPRPISCWSGGGGTARVRTRGGHMRAD
jgi:hypothetical protein